MAINKEAFTTWLNVWTKRKDISAKDLSEIADVGYINAYRWLRGERTCNLGNLITLIISLRHAEAITEPGELRHALHQMQVSLDDIKDRELIGILKKEHEDLLTWLENREETSMSLPLKHNPLPPGYLERTAEFTQLKTNLQKVPSQPVIIWGMAGCGKTTMARAAVEDPDIQRVFWNGVLWASLGPEGNPQRCLYHWCTLFDIAIHPGASVELLQKQLVLQMRSPEKRFLMVVDDVWDYQQLKELLLPADNLTWIFTSRDRTLITHFPDGQLLEIGAMNYTEASSLLHQLVGQELLTNEPNAASTELIELAARTPLAIRLVGHLVRLRGWDYVLSAMRDEHTRLLMLETGGALTRDVSMRMALQVSYDALSTVSQGYFRRLGVFGYGNDFSGLMVGGLWGLPHSEMSSAVLQTLGERELWSLHDVGLLERTTTEQGANRFRLHTLIHDYARALLREMGEFDTWRNAYILLYSRWGSDMATVPEQLEVEWENLKTAFAHACDLEKYEEATLLLASLHSFMLVRMDFRTLDKWLQHLETHWSTLSPTAQCIWDHVKARRLYAGGNWQEAQIFRRRYSANPQADNRLKGALCILEADLCWRYQEWAAAELALSEAAPFVSASEPKLQRQYQQLVIRLTHHRGDSASLEDELSKLVQMIDAEPDPLEQGDSFLFVAELYRDIGDFDRAETCLNSALMIAQSHKIIALEFSVLLELMQFCLQTERFSETLSLSTRLLKLLEPWPEGIEASERHAFVYQLMAAACIGQNDPTQALGYAQVALPFAAAAQNPLLMGRNFMLIGQVQTKRGALTEAITAYTAAIQHFGKTPELFDLLQMAAAEREQCYRLRDKAQ